MDSACGFSSSRSTTTCMCMKTPTSRRVSRSTISSGPSASMARASGIHSRGFRTNSIRNCSVPMPRGRSAGGHHGINLLLHLCNVALVYATFRGLLGRAEPAAPVCRDLRGASAECRKRGLGVRTPQRAVRRFSWRRFSPTSDMQPILDGHGIPRRRHALAGPDGASRWP